MIKLVLGLGNPGKRYEKTRHNVGFMVIDSLARRLRLKDCRIESLSCVYKAKIAGREILLAKPQTYMNSSGLAVVNLFEDNELFPENLLVIYDDLDLPLGKIRLRLEGSSGGHRGVESIIKEIKTQSFARLKVGISRPPRKEDVNDYVLSEFSDEEREICDRVIASSVSCVLSVLEKGVDESQNTCNVKL
ncbi:MAG: aminoacyl-tRNA hydrolase [Aquificaceae bacterium]|nr:aminoacyl-tRNA hydrolase [Aquificaceae bacterium]MDW8237315.1 aminoacyl-tRNA hydrolase [Aquificaceae bacterium]